MPGSNDGKVYKTPLDILTNKELDRKKSVMAQFYMPLIGGILGVGAGLVTNWRFRKPMMAGVQAHVAYGGVGALIGYYLDQKSVELSAERDAVLRHYIELHPEDFPPIERKRYRDVLEAWVPVR